MYQTDTAIRMIRNTREKKKRICKKLFNANNKFNTEKGNSSKDVRNQAVHTKKGQERKKENIMD